MMSGLRWRLALVICLTTFAGLTVVPTFTDISRWPAVIRQIVPEKRINLGLDLKGGLYLVARVEIMAAFRKNLEQISSDLKAQFIEQSLQVERLVISDDDFLIDIRFSDANTADKARRWALTHYRGVLDEIRQADQANDLTFVLQERYLEEIREHTLEQVLEKIRNRVDEFGVSEPDIRSDPKSKDRIIIQIAGQENAARGKELIKTQAFLEFKMVDETNYPSWGSDRIAGLVGQAAEKLGIADRDKPAGFALTVDNMRRINAALRAQLPTGTQVLFEPPREDDLGGLRLAIWWLVLEKTELTGDMIINASVQWDELDQANVGIDFDPRGADIFKRVTTDNVGKRFAVILDSVVRSAPQIEEPIPNGRCRITLGTTDRQQRLEEANQLALVLRTGAYPAPVSILEERTVGPSLGADSIAKGQRACWIGALLVVFFMVVWYRFPGLVANFALMLNILFILSFFALQQANLTLPGIAGIALTVGMAVDANVIIFERIREELALGRSTSAALQAGYERTWLTLLDSNVTTAIAGVVLLQFGSGPVRGFATTLLVGIASSMFTAIFVTRVIFDYLTRRASFRFSFAQRR